MSLDHLAEKCGVTPAKLALICVLSIVLVAVVYRNFVRGPSGAETALSAASAGHESGESAAEKEPAKPIPASPAQQPLEPQKIVPPRRTWPKFDLAETIARDPFAIPERFPESLVQASAAGDSAEAAATVPLQGQAPDAERSAALAALQQEGVQLVLQNGREYVAKIGDREVRVGDRIDGFRVVEISLIRGVYLEGDASP